MLEALKYTLTIIDILVVAFIFYKAFMLIRGTRAIQALKGLAILVAISALASFGRLHTLDWLLRKFWTWGAVAFIILFAPELKSALARMGGTAAFLTGSFPDETEPIREVVQAAERLSASRAGALIVMAREASLDDIISSGIALDARVSRELLMSIFYPDNELHDGAVIIKNGRLAAASCILPLSNSNRWEQALGTRHRAAIGLTEETDAVVVVVSEETGVISVAMKGEITRYLEPQSLQAVLVDALLTTQDEPETSPKSGSDENT